MPNIPGTLLFPGQLDDLDSLIRAQNNAGTTLTSAVDSSVNSLPVASTASFPSTGALTVEGEIIFYTTTTGTAFNGCTRAGDGTSAAAHGTGAVVEGLIVAAHHNELAAGIVAVETKLGSGASTPVNGSVLQGNGTGSSAWNTSGYFSGTLGVGVAPVASRTLNVAGNVSNSAAQLAGAWFVSSFDSPTASSNSFHGILANPTFNGTGATAQPNYSGIGSVPSVGSGASAPITNLYSFYARLDHNGSSTVANYYGLRVINPTGSGSITNAYGLYIETPTRGGTANYALYCAGGSSYHAGSLGIGAAPNAAAIGLNLQRQSTNPAYDSSAGYYYAYSALNSVNLTANSDSTWRAYGGGTTVQTGGAYNAAQIIGHRINAYHLGTGVVGTHLGAQFNVNGGPTSAGTGSTSTNVTAGQFLAAQTGAGTWSVTNLKLAEITIPSVTGGGLTGTNLYGLYVNDFSNPGGTWTNKYALYVAGGTSYHAGNVGIGSGASSANSILQVAGAIATAVSTKTGASTLTLTASDSVVLANATSGAFTLTLPTAVGITGRQYRLVKIDSSTYAVTITTTSSQTINGASSFSLAARWDKVTLVSDGSNWIVV